MATSDRDLLTVECPICKRHETQTVETFREANDPTCPICKGFLYDAITKEFVRKGLIPPQRKRV